MEKYEANEHAATSNGISQPLSGHPKTSSRTPSTTHNTTPATQPTAQIANPNTMSTLDSEIIYDAPMNPTTSTTGTTGSSGSRAARNTSAQSYVSEVKICFQNIIYTEPCFISRRAAEAIENYSPSLCNLSFIPDRTCYQSPARADGSTVEYRMCDSYCTVHSCNCPVQPRRRLLAVGVRNSEGVLISFDPLVNRSKRPSPGFSPTATAPKRATPGRVVSIDLTREEAPAEAPIPPGSRASLTTKLDGYDTAPDTSA